MFDCLEGAQQSKRTLGPLSFDTPTLHRRPLSYLCLGSQAVLSGATGSEIEEDTMRRKTFDALLTTGGLVVAVILAVAGGLLSWGHNSAESNVHSQLASQ